MKIDLLYADRQLEVADTAICSAVEYLMKAGQMELGFQVQHVRHKLARKRRNIKIKKASR